MSLVDIKTQIKDTNKTINMSVHLENLDSVNKIRINNIVNVFIETFDWNTL